MTSSGSTQEQAAAAAAAAAGTADSMSMGWSSTARSLALVPPPGVVHTRAVREAAVATWLLSSADDRAQARAEWDETGLALLRCRGLYTAVRIEADLVHAAAGTTESAAVDAYLDAALLGGPVPAYPSWWCVQMDGPGALCDADAVSRLCGHARHRRMEWDAKPVRLRPVTVGEVLSAGVSVANARSRGELL